jgi:Protein of unknown function (DUF2690)
MTTPHFNRFPQRIRVGLGCILFFALLVGVLAVTTSTGFPLHARAASLQQKAGMTCVQAPSMGHCNNQDPELQGCAADAVTAAQANIDENGVTIGRVERRFSLKCNSWWGRVFDNRPGSQGDMFITIEGTTTSAAPTFIGLHYRILYSPMVFDATPTMQVPAITGSLTINAIARPSSATIPSIAIP